MMKEKRMLMLLIVVVVSAIVLSAVVSAQPADAFNYDASQLGNLGLACASEFECKQANIKDVFFYNCSYDLMSAQCQCSQGEFSRCNVSRSSLDSKQIAALKKGTPLVGRVAGALKAAPAKFGSLPLLAKAAAAIFVIAVIVAVLLRARDNAANNFRRAQSLHQAASELHERGDEEKAKLLFEKANYFREKAYDEQQKVL